MLPLNRALQHPVVLSPTINLYLLPQYLNTRPLVQIPRPLTILPSIISAK